MDYEINETEYRSTMPKVNTTEPVHADFVNRIFQNFLDNDNYLNAHKANVSLSQTATLLAEAWEGEEAPYTYTLPVEGATDTNNIEVLPAVPLTQEQYEAMSGACITGAGQAEGSITLDAWGDKPEIDLPIIVIVRGD